MLQPYNKGYNNLSDGIDSISRRDIASGQSIFKVTSGATQIAQKVSEVINSIKGQGFEVKELEVDAEKEE